MNLTTNILAFLLKKKRGGKDDEEQKNIFGFVGLNFNFFNRNFCICSIDYYVTAYGTVYWRDNLGVNNEFLGASGGWDSDINPATNKKPTLSNKSATIHGQSYARDYVYKQITPTGMTYSISKSSFNYKRWEFWLTSAVTVNGKDKLNLKVSTRFLT